MSDFMKFLAKNRNSNDFLTATVTTLNPLTAKIIPTDDAINVVPTNGLNGMSVGSRILMLKYLDQFIGVAVISSNTYPIGWYSYVIKPSDTSKTNDTTLADDPHLTLTLPRNGIYEVFLALAIDAENTTADFKSTWNINNITEEVARTPTGPGLSITSLYNAEYSRYVCASLTAGAYFGLSGSGYSGVKEFFVVSTDSNDGTLSFQWAQNVSDATNVTLKSGSYLRAVKIDNN